MVNIWEKQMAYLIYGKVEMTQVKSLRYNLEVARECQMPFFSAFLRSAQLSPGLPFPSDEFCL